MADRTKKRVGRIVRYTPTAAEVTANGAGPWAGLITAVNADGTVNLNVAPPTVTALVAEVIAAADGTAAVVADADTATSPDGSDAGTTQTLANELKADWNLAVPLINEIKDNYNLVVTLINELKARMDEILPRSGATQKLSISEGSSAGTFSFIAGSDSV